MLLFYVVAGAVALAVGLALARPLIGGAGGVSSREAADADLYRDQLAEIERDLERGAISPAEAEGARAEVSRRLLGAAGRAEQAGRLTAAPRRQAQLAAGMALIGAPVLAVVVYLGVGAPGMAERGGAERGAESAEQAGRLSQAEAEALVPEREREAPAGEISAEMQQYTELIERLEGVLEERPNDRRGLEMLANGYGRLGRHEDAWRAWRRLIEAAGEQAEAEHYARMAEAMVMATDGYVSPEAEAALDEALARKPELAVARYYDALAMAQGGRLDAAIAAWERLQAETSPDAPRYAFLERTLAEARALRDGDGRGPSEEEIAAAEEMSPADREAMIEGMVTRLEQRLTSEGGEPEEWVRLMNAYVQLDRPEDAERIAALGIESFGSSSAADFVREQALLMGLEPE